MSQQDETITNTALKKLLQEKSAALEKLQRELEIEAALEKVRARTMAMQQSDELSETASEMFRQIQLLGLKTWSCGFNIIDKEKRQITQWVSSGDGRILPAFVTPSDEDVFQRFTIAAEKDNSLYVEEMGGEALKEHYQYMSSLPELKKILDEFSSLQITPPDFQVFHVASFSYGYLMFITYQPAPEFYDVFKRFATVFDQTYRRFLDLQRAEEQARESQIQLALERVRARTMAMQKSEELTDAANLLFQQIQTLGMPAWSAGYCILDENKKNATIWMSSEGVLQPPFRAPLTEEASFIRMREAYERGEKFYVEEVGGELLKMRYQYMRTLPVAREILNSIIEAGYPLPTFQIFHFAYFSQGFLLFITYKPVLEAHDIFKRFGNVFDQTYTRFLDLQKAEAQAKEAQIEAALEKVRSRSLAVYKSDEFNEVIKMVFERLQELEIPMTSASINIVIDGSKDTESYICGFGEGGLTLSHIRLIYFNHPIANDRYNAYEKGLEFFTKTYNKEEKNSFFKYEFEVSDLKHIPADIKKIVMESERYTISMALTKNSMIVVNDFEGKTLSSNQIDIVKRFSRVFEQAYIRFLDLQKAEAQSRESQIEAALESVRSASLAMHRSDQLKMVATVMFKKFTELGLTLTGAFIFLFDAKTRDIQLWIATTTLSEASDINIPYTPEISKNLIFKDLWNLIENGQEIFNRTYSDTEKNDYFRHTGKYNNFPQEVKDFHQEAKSWTTSIVGEKHAAIGFDSWDEKLATAGEFQILKRFSKVFEQAYVRFLDLQKAEAQLRESQIEAALESVRSASLAMHHSNQLKTVATVMFKKLTELGLTLTGAFIFLYDKETRNLQAWIATTALSEPVEINTPYSVTIAKNQIFKDEWSVFETGEEIFNRKYSGKTKNDFFRYVGAHNDYQQEVKDFQLKAKSWIISIAGEKHCAVGFDSWEGRFALPEDYKILKRFARAFEQAYVRFLDLQKAEAQSREAQIELSLERVRAKTMAMHNSADVGETAAVMVDELKKLGIETIRCGIGIMHEPGDMEVWTISTNENNKTDIIIGWLDMNMHPLLHGAFDSWRNKIETYSYDLKDDDLLSYYNAINNYPGYPIRYDISNLPKQIHHNEFHFAEGTLFAFSLQQLTDEQRKIFKRFAGVFGQTYRRYLDLKRAEAQAKEAQIEAALERVRSRTLAMQKSDELAETSAVLFKQLISLGIKPNRLYISIMKDDAGNTEFWITDEDGSKVSMAYEDNLNSNASFKKMYEGWQRQKKSLVIDMQGKELQDYFHHLGEELHVPFKGGLAQKRRLQYIAYFSKGFIGMASPDEQPEATIQLLERFAYAFNLTFTRFNDLQIAETHAVQAEQDLIEIKNARQKAEDTLSELQITQKQLIQSEKMASLGELTAGIAHEIQNPLNFVNNFSEVSKELLDEMKTALENGDKDEAEAIANDIIQNLEKINHHGKRADAIVKGMLQHSRQTKGIKEPTDINALCDEYLRLSYHGLRAKDKNFNADFKTDFDNSIGKINIVPQDIGRVLLNLFNNAFYAVSKPPSPKGENYKPLVSITTRKIKLANSTPSGDGGIEIKVTDNGNGIPSNIVDKIFQPFFTTKPTGQGTGLGLSLAYDIITKEHNGTIKVVSKEGEGSEFIIQLPV